MPCLDVFRVTPQKLKFQKSLDNRIRIDYYCSVEPASDRHAIFLGEKT